MSSCRRRTKFLPFVVAFVTRTEGLGRDTLSPLPSYRPSGTQTSAQIQTQNSRSFHSDKVGGFYIPAPANENPFHQMSTYFFTEPKTSYCPPICPLAKDQLAGYMRARAPTERSISGMPLYRVAKVSPPMLMIGIPPRRPP